jgi:hypothetical protein
MTLSVARLHGVDWMDKWMMICKGFGRKQSWLKRGNILAFAWRDWGRQWTTSIMIADVPDKIRTEHLNSSRARYRYSSPRNHYRQSCMHVCSSFHLSVSPKRRVVEKNRWRQKVFLFERERWEEFNTAATWLGLRPGQRISFPITSFIRKPLTVVGSRQQCSRGDSDLAGSSAWGRGARHLL